LSLVQAVVAKTSLGSNNFSLAEAAFTLFRISCDHTQWNH